MKKPRLLCAGILYACVLSAQPSFQTSLEAGISLPLNSNNINATHAGNAIHFGNNLDYTFGNNNIRFGLGAYMGYINSISTSDKYKEIGAAIAEKYGFAATGLVFNSSEFKSTHLLLGPVASFGSDKFNINIWAKGGYGLNEPSRYTVTYRENGIANNIYINQAGEHKNGLAYTAGAGVNLAISSYVAFRLSAGYFSTQTDQVNYNFDREKGTRPLYYTSSNQFIQASAGLQFNIGGPGKKISSRYTDIDTGSPVASRMDQKIKTKSNIKNDRVVNPLANGPEQARINKSKSNVKNNRVLNDAGNDTGDDDADTDSLLFTPQKIELRSKISSAGMSRIQLQAVDNYLTGFAYQAQSGAVISQCGSNAMPGDPIPGIDVRLKRLGGTANDLLSTRTNKDGSFAFSNITPGDYTAEAGGSIMDITVNGNNENVFRTLDVMGGSCGDTKENYIISAGDKTYVEVISARETGSGMATGRKHIGNVKYEDIKVVMDREAGSGMATGRRMHKPYRVADMDFEINTGKIYSSDGKLYAEVITAREAGSGMATGRRSTIVTGDVDGDGFDDYSVVSPRDAASGQSTGRRMHKPFVIIKDLDAASGIAIDEPGVHRSIAAPRDAASGLATGKRMHKPMMIIVDEAAGSYEIVSPRDAASGQSTGRRQYNPVVITKEIDQRNDERVSPRDAASGLPTGKRMHKPFIVTVNDQDDIEAIVAPRDAASGQATGRRQYQPLIIRIDPVEDSYELVSPRDAASGLPTGKRMHKPFVITKELDIADNGNEVVTYSIIHRDLAARNVLPDDEDDTAPQKMAIKEQGMPANKGNKKGIITGKDNDTGMFEDREAGSGVATGRRANKNMGDGYQPWDQNDADGNVVSNPLYQSTGGQGENPMFEGKNDLRVMGSNGKAHDIFIPSNMMVVPASQPPTAYASYDVVPIKWMAPESLGAGAAGKSNNGKGIKMAADKMEANAERKGWDGTIKGSGATGKSINEKGIKRSEDVIVRGWDPVVKQINRLRCADGTCSVEATVEWDGAEYEAVISGILKTKHDTVKNSIGNIR